MPSREVQLIKDVITLPFDIGYGIAERGAALASPQMEKSVRGVGEAFYDPQSILKRQSGVDFLNSTPAGQQINQQFERAGRMIAAADEQGLGPDDMLRRDAQNMALAGTGSLLQLRNSLSMNGLDRTLLDPMIQEGVRLAGWSNNPAGRGGPTTANRLEGAIAPGPEEQARAFRGAPVTTATEQSIEMQPGRLEAQGIQNRTDVAEEERRAKAFPTQQAYTQALTGESAERAKRMKEMLPFEKRQMSEEYKGAHFKRRADEWALKHAAPAEVDRDVAYAEWLREKPRGGGKDILSPENMEFLREWQDEQAKPPDPGEPVQPELSYEDQLDLLMTAQPSDLYSEETLMKLDPANPEPLYEEQVREDLRQRRITDPRIAKMAWEAIKSGHRLRGKRQ